MLLYFFILMGLVGAGGAALIFWQQLNFIRTANLELEGHLEPDLEEMIQRQIDLFYRRFAWFWSQALHYAYLYSLLSIRWVIVLVRFVLTRIERKFSRLIDSVHGRGMVLRRDGPVSPFLSQITKSDSR